MDIKAIRKDFPALEKLTYLDSAFVGLVPNFVREGYTEFLDEWANFSFDPSKTILGRWRDKAEETRTMIAKFIGASPDEIAFTQNTGCGLNIPVNGLTWKKGDNVVTLDWEHNPLVTSTLKRNGVESRIVKSANGKVELRDIEKAIDDNTKIVQLSQVEFVNGFRFDLKAVSEMIHKHGAMLLTDSTQALGALKTDVKKEDVDFISAGTYKYLLGPAGLGILYAKAEHIEKLMPDRTGWSNKIWEMKPHELPSSAKRFEYGTLNYQGIYAFHNSLIYLNKIGIENIEKRILELSSYLQSRVIDLGARLFTPKGTKSPIVCFFIKDAQEIAKKLRNEDVKVTAREWDGESYFRVSFHFYNTKEDIDCFLDKLKEITKVQIKQHLS
jgi:selenocysteine lyase/cysteine desulfurase